MLTPASPRGRGARYKGTKAKLLRLLKERGGATAMQLAEALSVTRACVHSHLHDLSAVGLVRQGVMNERGRGRPGHLYELTEAGEDFFPKDYARLATDILAQVQELYGAEALSRIFDGRNQRLTGHLKAQAEALALPERLELLATCLSEHGYEARVVKDGEDYLLLLGNCPFPAVAEKHMEVCRAEQGLHQEVLGLAVTRESRIVDGAPCCTYRVLRPS